AGVLPIECDENGNSLPLGAALGEEQRVSRFKDAEGRIRRQAARFGVWVYDDDSPEGRPLKIGDPIAGGGNHGTLIDIQWRVHLANKKASWYEFQQLQGEHGYEAGHPRRNPQVQGADARQRLIIDPGPRVVSFAGRRSAEFWRDGGGQYAATFPPPLKPRDIDTLGALLVDGEARLLVLGGHGNSGSYLFDEFGQPRIEQYANNDGWFDDTSDGPVMARLVMHSEEVDATRYIDVEYPAWVLAAYPDYVPQIPDIVTMDEVVEDLAVRQFAYRTDLYGTAGTFDCPEHVDPWDQEALLVWQGGRLEWNAEHRPWFWRDIWPILWRPEMYMYLTSVLALSNDPHNQSTRGTFYPGRIGTPPSVAWPRVAECLRGCLERGAVAEMAIEPIRPVLERLVRQAAESGPGVDRGPGADTPMLKAAAPSGEAAVSSADALLAGLRDAVAEFAAEPEGGEAAEGAGAAEGERGPLLKSAAPAPPAPTTSPAAREKLEARIGELLDAQFGPRESAWPRRGTALQAEQTPVWNSAPEDRRPTGLRERVEIAIRQQTRRLFSGELHRACFRDCVAANTSDLYGAERTFLFALLREPGHENEFARRGPATSRTHNLPLMPLLSGDNPITNTLPSKFLRLTDLQYYLLKQWAEGKFINEYDEGWIPVPNPDNPFPGGPITSGRQLDQGVMSRIVGGAFCPGGEVGWIMRNPAIYRQPWRIKADPAFWQFTLTAAQANAWRGNIPETDYISYAGSDLGQGDDFDTGLQPGDLTKSMALPWQSDFNECSSQTIDVTYELWNVIDFTDPQNELLARQQRQWETLWWPAHRPMQNWEPADTPGSYRWLDWARGVTQTNAGDLKMVTEWPRFTFVVRNPQNDPDHAFIGIERTHRSRER
ncbi:MAG TPA: LodA/GoxA family CTQ-dependent oxidase, partial [Longimicrobiaceae bacterium]